MFQLGILGLAQMLFIPGFLLLRLLRLRPGAGTTCLASIPLSLVINHFLVIGLVLAGRYTRRALVVVLLLEVAGFVALLWRERRVGTGSEEAGGAARWRALAQDLSQRPALHAVTFWAGALLAGAVTLLTTFRALDNLGTVYSIFDAVVSWNRWAVSWASNGLPTMTWRYPQLLPINASLTYVWIGSPDVQLFAKAAMGAFPVASLLMLGDLAVRRRSAGYLVALVGLGALNLTTLEWLLVEGYADLPVAFMVMASLYLVVLAQDAADRSAQASWIGLAVVVAAGAALTKQGGILWAAAFPIIAALEWRDLRRGEEPSRPQPWVVLLASGGVIVTLVAPWYAYKQLQFRRGTDTTEQVYVEQANGGRTFGQRAAHVHEMLVAATSTSVVDLILPLALLGALTSRRWRRPTILFAVPYAAIGVGLTSYDLRNFSPIWPILLTSGGAGWADLLAPRLASGLPRLPRPWPAAMGCGLAFFLATTMLGDRVSGGRLRSIQVAQQRKLGGERLSAALYEYVDRQGLKGRILTDLQPLKYMPEMEANYTWADLIHPDQFHLAFADPGNRYLLVPIRSGVLFDEAIRKDLDSRLERGTLRLVFEADGRQFIEKTESPAP